MGRAPVAYWIHTHTHTHTLATPFTTSAIPPAISATALTTSLARQRQLPGITITTDMVSTVTCTAWLVVQEYILWNSTSSPAPSPHLFPRPFASTVTASISTTIAPVSVLHLDLVRDRG